MKLKITALLTLLFLLSAVSATHSQIRTVTLLYTNDIESVYKPVEAFWNDEIGHIGGMQYLASLINKIRAEEKVSFLFDAGDIFTGALSQTTEGKFPFDVYSSMKYDAVNLGNHEFEYSWKTLSINMQRARFPILNSNIFFENTDIPFCRAYTILEKDGIRIGVIGLMGLEAFKNTINPIHRKGLEIRDTAPIVQKYVDMLRDEVDLIVVLTHQNRSSPMQTDKEADPEVQRGFDEDYALAGNLKGVDVIIGGHSDNGLWQPVRHPKTGTLICMTFGQSKYLGYLKLEVDKSNKSVALKEGKLIPVDADKLKPDKSVMELLDKIRTVHPELTKILAEAKSMGTRKYYKESNLGNLLADILRKASGADIALMNSGSIRADLIPGNVTVEDVINIYPFIGKYHTVEIGGKDLTDLLEYSYTLTYGLVQLSGLTAKYNSKQPPGRRLTEAKINNIPLDPEKKYTVSCSAFVANGGDGFYMIKNGKLISKSNERMIDAFIRYFENEKVISLPAIGRQIDIRE